MAVASKTGSKGRFAVRLASKKADVQKPKEHDSKKSDEPVVLTTAVPPPLGSAAISASPVTTRQPIPIPSVWRRIFKKKEETASASFSLPTSIPTKIATKRDAVVPSGFFSRLFRTATAETSQGRAAIEKSVAHKTGSVLRKKDKKAKQERRSAQYRKRMLGSILLKAGYQVKPEQLQRLVIFLTFGVIGAVTFITLMIAAYAGKEAGGLLLFYIGVWTALFAFVYLLLWMVIYLYLDIRIYQRTKELEDVLPDFLQLASSNISAGMPIDRALWFAIRPNFGVLANEIEEVAKATLAGEELSDSLTKFTERYDSIVLKRSINILLEGLAAGGELADLLNKIALNIQEMRIQKKEMSANVMTYAIFITFSAIVMAPVLFALATELLQIIVRITGSLETGSGGGFLTLNVKTTPQMVDDFKHFSIAMLSITAIMSASIVSVIRRGRVKDGLRNLPLFVAVSLTIYYAALWLLHAMLGSLF